MREYDGSEDPNLWIAHVKRVTAANNWDGERAIAHAMAALTGPTALWLESKGSEVEMIAELKQGWFSASVAQIFQTWSTHSYVR